MAGVDAKAAPLRDQPVPADRIRLLVQVGDDLSLALEDSTAVYRILGDALVTLPADAAAIWSLTEAGRPELAQVCAADPRRERELAAQFELWGAKHTTGLGHVLSTGRPARLGPVPSGSERLMLPGPLGRFAGTILAPITGQADGVPAGAVAVSRIERAESFTQADLDFVQLLCRRAGTTLETARLFGAVRDRATVVDSVTDAVIATDRYGQVTTWNPAAERIYGVPTAEALGRPLTELVTDLSVQDGTPADVAGAVELTQRTSPRTGVRGGRVLQRSASGRSVEVESSVTARYDSRGAYDGQVAVNRDLSELLAMRSAATAQERFTRDLMDALDSRAAVLDAHGVVLSANTRWVAGLTERDRCICGPVAESSDWLGGLRTSRSPDVLRFAGEVEDVLRGIRALARLECRCLPAGPERATAIEVAALRGAGGGAVVVQSDVSWRRRLEDELTHRATHDELTGLPNRAALMERLRASISRLQDGQMLAVLFCDLDGFKDINDGLGHAVGDQVLVAVARRLRQRCRSADVVARFGGDEFVIVQPVPDVARARATADRLVEALAEPISVGDAEVAPGASIGITVVDSLPPGDDPVGTLLRDADTAMYHAKERGRRRHELFDARLRVDISERLQYASALRRAVGNSELELLYQTRRYCGDRRVAGVEALMRWSPAQFGPVPPATFIPIAERTGRIVEVGGWALRQAMAEMSELEDRRLTVAVNVSPRQLSAPRMVEQVDTALASSGLEPWRLVLEITEGALVDEPLAARSVLTDLRRLGVTIALDDFGTGWSSMSYLRTLPVDVLKIDRSFVADLPCDPDACAVVAAVLGLGHGMGLVVVAEGVEDELQLDILRDMGCDEYQGFIDGPPGQLGTVLSVEA